MSAWVFTRIDGKVWGALVILSATFLWLMYPARATPSKHHAASLLPLVQASDAHVHAWVEGPAQPGTAYVAPDCRVDILPGCRACCLSVKDGVRLKLDAGTLVCVNSGKTVVIIETAIGVLSQASEEPLEAEICLVPDARGSSSLWLREASADDAVSLEITVRRGRMLLERGLGAATLIKSGCRLRTSAQGGDEFEGVACEACGIAPKRIHIRYDSLLELSGKAATLLFPPLPSAQAACWEVEVYLEESTVGLAVPVAGRMHAWLLPVVDRPIKSSGWHRLRGVIRGNWFEGYLDGRKVVSLQDATHLTEWPLSGPGLVVWGSARVREIQGEVLP